MIIVEKLISEAGLGLVALQMLACGALILFAGIRLVRSGDAMGDILGLNKAWIGLAFLAVITSLPELTTSVSAVSIKGLEAADLSVGNALGASTYNLLIIAVLDLIQGRGPVLLQVKTKHILAAALSVVMIGLVAFGVALGSAAPHVAARAGWVVSILLVLAYFGIMRTLFVYERSNPDERVVEKTTSYPSHRPVYLTFLVSSLVVVAAGVWLVLLADRLAELPIHLFGREITFGRTFVGTVFLAVCTTLPEVVVSISAFKIGGLDMAVGTIFGSNICNMVFPALADFVTPSSTIFLHTSNVHVMTAILATVITMIAVAGLKLRSSRSVLYVGWDVAVMVLAYIAGMCMIFMAR